MPTKSSGRWLVDGGILFIGFIIVRFFSVAQLVLDRRISLLPGRKQVAIDKFVNAQ